jgi:arylformamidase
MIFPAITDWDDAYANGAHIAGGDGYVARWAKEAQNFRDQVGNRSKLDLSYGRSPRNRLDVFVPNSVAKGVFVFVHGGYWMRFDKNSWSHLAQGALSRGFIVSMPSYTLCPDIRIGGIVREVANAIAQSAELIEGPVYLAGHSAGGHLVCRMMTSSSPLPEAVRRRVAHVVSISGVHDLRPIMGTQMNATLRLDEEEARAESPALLEPSPGLRLTCWVGAGERAEFLRQNALMANIWRGLGAATAAVVEDNRHHFNVVEGLSDPDSPLTKALFEA